MTVAVIPATLEVLRAYLRDPDQFADLINSPIPHGWPMFPEGIENTVDKFCERPDQTDWWLHLFFASDGRLVGSGGFVGPPEDGVVEIGYEIAPAHRGLGLATAAARALVAKAFGEGGAHTVIAHTVDRDSPSASVLKRLEFRCLGETFDAEDGTIVRWELVDPTAC